MDKTIPVTLSHDYTRKVGNITLTEELILMMAKGQRFILSPSIVSKGSQGAGVKVISVSILPEPAQPKEEIPAWSSRFTFIEDTKSEMERTADDAIEAMKSRPGVWMESPWPVFTVDIMREGPVKFMEHPNIECKPNGLKRAWYRWDPNEGGTND